MCPSRSSYYAIRGRGARNCYECDRSRCKCCRVTMRKVKRGARQKWRHEIAEQVGAA